MTAAELPKFYLEGLLSLAFPCVLPLVPSYMAAIGAVDADELGERRSPRRVLRASLPFVLGLSTVFVAFGLGVASLAASGIADRQAVKHAAGIVLVVLGLSFLGLLPLPQRMVGTGLLVHARQTGSRILLGAAFAVCAAPCIGPLLGAAITDAARGQDVGAAGVALAVYAAGLSSAFLAVGLLFVPALGTLRWLRDHYRILQVVGGAILLVFGLLLFFDRDWWLQTATNHLLEAFGLG